MSTTTTTMVNMDQNIMDNTKSTKTTIKYSMIKNLNKTCSIFLSFIHFILVFLHFNFLLSCIQIFRLSSLVHSHSYAWIDLETPNRGFPKGPFPQWCKSDDCNFTVKEANSASCPRGKKDSASRQHPQAIAFARFRLEIQRWLDFYSIHPLQTFIWLWRVLVTQMQILDGQTIWRPFRGRLGIGRVYWVGIGGLRGHEWTWSYEVVQMGWLDVISEIWGVFRLQELVIW